MASKIRELTEEERKLPQAKYYDLPLAPCNPDLMKELEKGPMDPKNALKIEDINDLLLPGYVEGETGYCQMPDGTGYVAINNQFPGCTLEMIKWWFAWHTLKPVNYTIWNSERHESIRVDDTTRAKVLDPNIPLEEKYRDVVHYVAEDCNCGMEDIAISFKRPEDLGFDTSKFTEDNVGEIILGTGVSQLRAGGPKAAAVMCHFFRKTDAGYESRSRFWMGYTLIDGKITKVLPPNVQVPVEPIKGLAYHNVEEYSNLAVLLPKIYEEMNGELVDN